LINGLLYIHASRILHCDIKLDNLLLFLGENGELQLKYSDFGLSLDMQEEVLLADRYGSLQYSAPEFFMHSYASAKDLSLGSHCFAENGKPYGLQPKISMHSESRVHQS